MFSQQFGGNLTVADLKDCIVRCVTEASQCHNEISVPSSCCRVVKNIGR